MEAASARDPVRLAARLSKGFSWNLGAAVSNQGGTFAANVIVARLLGPHDFGLYAMVQATLIPLAMVVYWATGTTAAKYVAEYRSADRERAGRVVSLCGSACVAASALIGLLLVATAGPLAATVLEAPQLAPCLMLGALYVIGTSCAGYQTGILTGLEAFSGLARAALCSSLIAVAGIALGASLLGVLGAVLALALTALVRVAVHHVWVRRGLRQAGIPVAQHGMLGERDVLGGFALPIAVAATFNMLMVWPVNLILVRQPDGYIQLALYSAGMNVRTLALFLPIVLNGVIQAAVNHLKGGGEADGYHRLVRSNLVATSFLGLLGAAALWSVGGQVLNLFGADFRMSTALLVPFLLASVCETTTLALVQPVHAQGRIWLCFLGVTAPRDCLFLVTAWLLVPGAGAEGMAWSFFIASGYALVGTAVIAWWLGRADARLAHVVD